MEQAIANFSDWLAATQPSLVIQIVPWIIPMVQSVHIMAITVVVGAVLMIDLKLLGLAGRGAAVWAITDRFLPWIWVALVVLLLTGLILITGEPRRDLLNNTFRLKIILIVVVVAVTLGFQRVVDRDRAAWGERPPHPWPARVLAIFTLAVWIGILMCGRWIAYVEHG